MLVTTTNRTRRDRTTCEFYDDIDEFIASSDKVNPKFVKETNVASQKREVSEEVSAGEEGDCVATTADPITGTEPGEDNTKIKQPNKKKNPSGLQRKKGKTSSIDSTYTENGTYTKRRPQVHGPPLWTRSMDYPCGLPLILQSYKHKNL